VRYAVGFQVAPQASAKWGELAVFGMLDYRAHKLFFLFMLPLWLTSKISYYVCIAVGILIAQSTGYDFWAKVIIAYACTELLAAVVLGVWWAVNLLAQKLFFWIVDVIPAKGDNDEEAKEIVKKGRLIWLGKKFNSDVQNWNYEDTNALASTLNWRARMFFNIKDRIKQRILIFQQHWDYLCTVAPQHLMPASISWIPPCASQFIFPRWLCQYTNATNSDFGTGRVNPDVS
jgi:hypothetical protein